MIKILFATLSISFLIPLMGCKEKVQSVEWYKIHDEERRKVRMKCTPMNMDQNCLNADQAESEKVWGPKKKDDDRSSASKKGKLKPLTWGPDRKD